MVKRLSTVVAVGLLAGWAGGAQAQRGPGGFGPGFGPGGFGFGPGMGRVVMGEPYTASATESSTDTLSNGTTITHSSTISEARDTEGRTYRSVTVAATATEPSYTRTTVFDPVAHTLTEWSSKSTTATQVTLPANPPGGRGRWAGGPGAGGPPPAGGRGERFGGQVTRTTLSPQTIAGVTADGVETTVTVPAGAEGNSQPLVSTREVWTSPTLKIVLEEKSTDPRMGTHTMEVTSLTPGTPDSTLFQVPSGYTVKTVTRHRGGN